MKKIKTILLSTLAIVSFSCQNSDSESIENPSDYIPIENPNATPYITEVVDFSPAPGQFINYSTNAETKENIIGSSDQFMSLGTFGGNVTFKFDHSILNTDGNDLAIYGNSFKGSSEPGIVMVCQDLNHNGLVDDNEPWYALKGSEFNKSSTKHQYSITYYKPSATENQHIINYTSSYNGTEENGKMDFTAVIPYHDHPMFPAEYTENEITFTGTLLASNTTKEGDVYYNNKYDWGYSDNAGYENEEKLRGADLFDFKNAVDINGQAVQLNAVDFIKVYTCTKEVNGWLGERSTEIIKAADLSLLSNEK
ncbi:hypothetical protein EI427_22200 [Flammeovirga pectinis]|uniref:PKD domain-containing protein n=1 Tax=Flammeovirga pectinis TaxID=2494373 RepID=A0A3Q9FUM2_9BACT|nr:hypothetical protein [Flammeovirga pectinis]AZQ64941.1 hypothetical protein EI427_22200 [Flammeovirga pectinis]